MIVVVGVREVIDSPELADTKGRQYRESVWKGP